MARLKNNKLFAPIGIAVVLTVITLTGILFSFRNQANRGFIQEPSTLTEKQVEEEIKNGVYTNYTYGFRFEYPEANLKYDEGSSTSDIAAFKLLGESEFPIALIVRGDTNFEIFNTLTDPEKTQIENDEATITRLQLKQTDEYKFVETLSKPKPDFASDQNIAYQAVWIPEHQPMITITLVSNTLNERSLTSNKFILDKIVRSFEFINQ